jgi:hypothetical protein
MHYRIILGLFMLAASVGAGGQEAARPLPPAPPFHWNFREIQELGVKDALDQTKALSPTERSTLIDTIAATLGSDGEGENSQSKAQLRAIASRTRVKLIDLNGNGKPEVIAQAVGLESGCSPTGNCPIWVFMKSGNQYKSILGRDAIQTFTIQPTSTNGLRDIVLGMHGSATEQELHLYRFEGQQYRETACYEANWSRLVGDDVQELKEPEIDPCGR